MIRKGNNKFKTLHKGSELITRVFKGDELIYQDIDALYSFKFTIDTRKTQTGGNNTNKTFSLSFGDLESPQQSVPYDPVLIDWGDGETTTTSNPSNQSYITFQHTYATAGEYQIKLLPTVFNGAVPSPGWLSGLSLTGDSNNAYRVLSIDKIFPEGSYNYSFHGTSRIPYRRCGQIFNLNSMRNLKHVPTNLFKNVNIIPMESGTPYGGSKFQYFAMQCGYNVTMANFDCDLTGILKVLLDKFDPNETARITGFSNFFRMTFYNAKIKKQIPADFFSHIHTDSATDLSNMFQQTFYSSWAAGSENETIPAGLFDTIVTSHATNVRSMFEGTFQYAFATSNGNAGSTTATIPDRLLPLDYSSVTGSSAENLFNSTFSGFSNSTAFEIPAHLFDGLKLPNITSAAGIFGFTFAGASKSTTSIPSSLFDNVTLSNSITSTYQMFKRTFEDVGQNASTNTATIPSGLFSFLSTANVTNMGEMFYETFGGYAVNSTAATIPANLFSSIDASSATTVQQMFYGTFYRFGQYSTAQDPIPATLFSFLSTAAPTTMYSLFNRTFASAFFYSTTAYIPSGLFSNLDVTNTTNVNSLFESTFSGVGRLNPTATIPAGLFSALNLQNTVSCSSLFSSTFARYAEENTTGQIPSTLFSTISAPNCTSTNSMFNGTFEACFKKSTVVTIPSGLFSALSTANVTSMNYMFANTFKEFAQYSTVATCPSDLFSYVDTTSATSMGYMFQYTFYKCFAPPYPVTIPATLLATIDTSNATNMNQMFVSMFDCASITDVPQGFFGGINVCSTSSDLFVNTFACSSYAQLIGSYQLIALNDPFDGMTDFSWATASDTGRLRQMFATGTHNSRYSWLSGSASTVLQHFNFTPNSDTNMFKNQDQLTDYATINANWK